MECLGTFRNGWVRDSKESGMESRATACSGTEWRAKFCYDKFGSGSGRKAGMVWRARIGQSWVRFGIS